VERGCADAWQKEHRICFTYVQSPCVKFFCCADAVGSTLRDLGLGWWVGYTGATASKPPTVRYPYQSTVVYGIYNLQHTGIPIRYTSNKVSSPHRSCDHTHFSAISGNDQPHLVLYSAPPGFILRQLVLSASTHFNTSCDRRLKSARRRRRQTRVLLLLGRRAPKTNSSSSSCSSSKQARWGCYITRSPSPCPAFRCRWWC